MSETETFEEGVGNPPDEGEVETLEVILLDQFVQIDPEISSNEKVFRET